MKQIYEMLYIKVTANLLKYVETNKDTISSTEIRDILKKAVEYAYAAKLDETAEYILANFNNIVDDLANNLDTLSNEYGYNYVEEKLTPEENEEITNHKLLIDFEVDLGIRQAPEVELVEVSNGPDFIE